jgi:hypothetical protein
MREHRVKRAYALARGLAVLWVLHELRAASLHHLLLATGIPKRGACSCYSPVTPAMKSKGGSMRFVARIIPRRAQWDNDPPARSNAPRAPRALADLSPCLQGLLRPVALRGILGRGGFST